MSGDTPIAASPWRDIFGACWKVKTYTLRQRLNKAAPRRCPQHDWNAFVTEAFRFEVLDTITPRDKPGYDVKRELSVLEELWLERLSPYGDRGYNDQPT